MYRDFFGMENIPFSRNVLRKCFTNPPLWQKPSAV
jgi:hypothetical protein